MVHGGGGLLWGSVHWGCVVCGRVVDQIVGDSALQRGRQLMAGRRQHDVTDMSRLVKQRWWHLVVLSIEGEAGVGTAIKAARGRVGAVEVRLANGPTGGDTIMALLVAWHTWQERAFGGCWAADHNLALFPMMGQLL